MIAPSVTVSPSPNISLEDLPAYTPPEQEQVSLTSFVNKGASQAWLTLRTRSMHTASSSSQTIPLYNNPGAVVAGDIVLLLEKPDSVQAVKIFLRGMSSHAVSGVQNNDGTTNVLGHKFVFLEMMQTLWSSSEGRPLYAEPPPWGFPQDGKLQGKYTFPFSFQLPVTIHVEPTASKDSPSTCDLPASLYDKKNPVAINYELSVTLVRGALKANTLINMNFLYAPRTRPDPPSELRQSAYADGLPALGPFEDPLGWQHVLPPPEVKAKLANGQTVQLACMLALAKPLTYSRGSFIPLHLCIQCADLRALELVQSPAAVSIILLQRIIVGKDAHVRKAKAGREDHLSPVARAVCWPVTNYAGHREDCRMLMGEITLPKKLPPSTVSPRVIVQYSVVMLPFDITGLMPYDARSFVVDQPVDIATHNADGPLSRSQMPQGYEDPRKDLIDNFDQMIYVMSKF